MVVVMKFLFFFVFVLMVTPGFGQSTQLIQAAVSRNQIDHPEHLQAFASQIAKWQNGKLDQVRIVQFGDSHIQTGQYPEGTRQGMLELFGTLTPRFWVPLSKCGGWGPPTVNFDAKGDWSCQKITKPEFPAEFGVSGFAYVLPANLSGNLQFQLSNKEPLTEVQILHQWNKSWSFKADSVKVKTVKIGEHSAITTITPTVSIRKVTLQVCGEGSKDSLRLFAFRLNASQQQHDLVYDNFGVGGSAYVDWIQKAPYFLEEMTWMKPDLIVLSLGTNDSHMGGFNDSSFYASVKKFVLSIKVSNPHASLLMTGPPDTYYKNAAAPNGIVVRTRLKQIAAETGCAFWNLFDVMGGTGSFQVWNNDGLGTADQMHFSKQGYELQGKLLADAIFRAMEGLEGNVVKYPRLFQ